MNGFTDHRQQTNGRMAGHQGVKGYSGYSQQVQGFRELESRQSSRGSSRGSFYERNQNRKPTSFANIGGGYQEQQRRQARKNGSYAQSNGNQYNSPVNLNDLDESLQASYQRQVRRDVFEKPPTPEKIIRPTENGFGHAFAYGSPHGHRKAPPSPTGYGGWGSKRTGRVALAGHQTMKKMGNKYVFGGMPKKIDQKANPLYHTAASEVGAKAMDRNITSLNVHGKFSMSQQFSRSFTAAPVANTGLITAMNKKGWGE